MSSPTHTTAAAPQPRRWAVEEWRTIAVTPLPPGWRNVYADPDGTEHTEPCPALLLQELTNIAYCREQGPPGSLDVCSYDEPQQGPRPTRVVYAAAIGQDAGEVEPAAEAANYVRTLSPDDEQEADR